ncbi:MAG TPA: MaoC/PaaZ C-terminal domain-containing protein [Leptospiraceae bacterium]|jgi:acyl dehydratase|nr:dehydratase [Leptospirales bacterium]HMU83950.1 MaoC/PaaZ C-terminal domain-containing protein [Leptospiraceae bacterium]HMW62105.1 MaoC/PaaZ C-terminal domain-containing protein [Leptospiraceae bacterium]HMX56744.1 MaoC/PaaZ C-terminal domain-containing protein [Leptospiraceae bacterium]HMY44716.1 MaoC/PaaZ C-terminal domain-containing protein [Leptospiraceae bacterium]
MKRIQFNEFEVGAKLPELKVGPVQHMDLVRYSGASGDFNPIHTDPTFAKSVGLDGTIAHGMYVMAQVGRMCTNWVHPAQIQFYGIKFKGMTKPGEMIVCTGEVKKKKEEDGKKLMTVSVSAANEAGEVKAAGDLVVVCD